MVFSQWYTFLISLWLHIDIQVFGIRFSNTGNTWFKVLVWTYLTVNSPLTPTTYFEFWVFRLKNSKKGSKGKKERYSIHTFSSILKVVKRTPFPFGYFLLVQLSELLLTSVPGCQRLLAASQETHVHTRTHIKWVTPANSWTHIYKDLNDIDTDTLKHVPDLFVSICGDSFRLQASLGKKNTKGCYSWKSRLDQYQFWPSPLITNTTVSTYCPQIKVFPFAAIYKNHACAHIRTHSMRMCPRAALSLFFLLFHEADATWLTLFSLLESV